MTNNKNKKDKPPPKKRGRKPKKKTNEPKPPPKKRGRKPKGGKILKSKKKMNVVTNTEPQNIILQLKCNSKDLFNEKFNVSNYNPNIENPKAFNLNTNSKLTELKYEEIKSYDNKINLNINEKINNSKNNLNNKNNQKNENNNDENTLNIKYIWEKINILKKKLKTNNVSDKRSACFWCTYPFDNPPIHIPKQYNGDCLEVYGCFCSPECALSYLKTEEIDDSTKWERNSLLNNVYGKIYNYSKNVKPAPNPYYTLDKYYGNLTIQEYRKLLSKERIYMVVNKPMTKILPELYEENNEIPNVYNNILETKEIDNNNNNFRLKRSQQKQSKTKALTNTFNMS
tara:strand:- start:1852 stop:2874 length:1023 start_codon:yes stop_codon:yes gene_type:complete